MKKLILFLALVTQFAFGQINTSTVTAGKYKMNIPDPGAKKDSAIVWDGISKLMKVLPISEIKGTTNLDQLATPTNITVFSSTGNDAVLPLVTGTNAGLMPPDSKNKLDAIEAGATANDTDANLKNRANHTGTQAISTVMGLQTSLDSKVDKVAGERLINASEITKLSNQSGTNTGDQDLSSYATNANLNLKENAANKNIANGYAGLGSDGKLISSQLPSITISDTFVTASQAAMLALTAETGDVSVRTDLNKSFILKGTNPTVLADWQELLTPTSAVTTVFGRNGAVTAQTGDYTADQITETATRKFQTATQNTVNDATSSIQTQLNGKQASLGFTPYNATNPAGYISSFTESDPSVPAYSKSLSAFSVIKPSTDALYEPLFAKLSAFNKNFGTAAGTVAEGNDSRILNGQTAFGWGNHAGVYLPLTGTASNSTKWNGLDIALLTYSSGTIASSLLYNSTNSRVEFGTAAHYQSWLGLNNGSTLTNSITGNAGSANNRILSSSILSTGYTIDGLRVGLSGSGTEYLLDQSGTRQFLGLGSNAYTSTGYLPLSGGYISGNLVLSGISNQIQFDAAAASDLFISAVPGTRIVEIRNGNATEPNYVACGLITGSGNFTNGLMVGSGARTGALVGISGISIGDSDTGFMQDGDGVLRTYANNTLVKTEQSTGVNFNLPINANSTITSASTMTATGFFNSSDKRLKDIIKRDGDVAYFKWKDKRDTQTHIGYIAQEVKKEYPDQVKKGEDRYLSVNYIEVLVAKIQALENRIKQLEKK